ncbi:MULTISPECIES: HAD-IIB family hydrolase [unclassified Acidovorax]|uniref:HAD-IIB family hydrolase n=1 Tax=unclassified Acidovorax TaxID=2684926 RepID=UPI002882FADF|nr:MULTISPECIES: HAD-IIB family hydrolase [unclassified Acidovorax]
MKSLALWPECDAARIRGVFTDIDDTLTTDGVITPEALIALSALKAAGLIVIPITGRPIGWCQAFLDGTHGMPLPVDAMVAENGAVAFVRGNRAPNTNAALPEFVKRYKEDGATRAAHAARLAEIAKQVAAEVPGAALSRDSAERETDIAFDYAEFACLPKEMVRQVLKVLQRSGLHTTVSSIHIHGCFGNVDKWQGARWIVREYMQRDLSRELADWVFVGDSGNDQAMFQHFTNSVGVANIARFVPELQNLPRYITREERGAGFAEVAQAILAARRVKQPMMAHCQIT